MQPRSNDSANKSLCCGHYTKMSFGNTFFVFYFLVSVAQCGYVNFFCSYSSKNEAVKLLSTLFNVFYYCCGATAGSEQQHNQDLKEIYKGR